MTRIEKIIEKFKENPTSITANDLVKILKLHWYFLDRTNGSHEIYKKPNSPSITLAKHNNTYKAVYFYKVFNTFYANSTDKE